MIRMPHTTPLPPIPSSITPSELARARKAAEEFESVFLNTMVAEMFTDLPTDGPFGGGQAEETYRSMLIEEYAKEMAAAGGIGLADSVLRDIIALQETSET
ncbi:rod-binding protein [Lutibaculum baratangense]|uniref:Flagellar protein FlgJ N-terminal domain-containing protein n=1 Tax=Lutibaculum baratangense AMV1 TaxID=631454 RepID=V4RNA8_9HYPH|nr:rod-binding protein [Lutibaculum baratangense]ESR26769.1 hypothetical protein N177_0553 [Lutibaculum baratangense AMV1]